MTELNPLVLVGAVIGAVTALLVLAYALVKDKKETMGFERTMADSEILRRLAGYAKPYRAKFVIVLFLMLFSIAYDIVSPLIVGALEELVSGDFALPQLYIGVAVYAASNLSYVSPDTPFSGKMTAEIYNIRTLVDLGGMAILFAHHMQLVEYRRKKERDALQNVLQAQYAQYRSAQDSIDLINKKYHDLKHQIAVLRSEASEEKAHYLDAMEQEIRSYEAQNKTGNEVLDTILTSKSLYCQQHGITLTCVADGAALDFMDTMDLCSLFGNALDNAIESVEKLPDSEQRLIHLVVARQKSFLWIRIENTYDDAFRADGTLPKTTKTDARYHGYGLKSIYDTAEKYGGTAEISTQENQFTLKVLFPIKQK